MIGLCMYTVKSVMEYFKQGMSEQEYPPEDVCNKWESSAQKEWVLSSVHPDMKFFARVRA